MEQTIIQSTKDVLKKKVNFFEQQQKERIITACKSDMKYAEVLAFIKNEIEMSEQDVSLNYNIKCWKTDGAFQFNKAVEEIFGSVRAEKDAGPSGSGNINTFDVILAASYAPIVQWIEQKISNLQMRVQFLLGVQFFFLGDEYGQVCCEVHLFIGS